MKTGTPMREKPSAKVCSVTVLPVPVAPVMRPWRFASSGSSKQVVAAFLAIRSGSAMVVPVEFGGISAVRQAKSKMHH
jgi:hypothetical protein